MFANLAIVVFGALRVKLCLLTQFTLHTVIYLFVLIFVLRQILFLLGLVPYHCLYFTIWNPCSLTNFILAHCLNSIICLVNI